MNNDDNISRISEVIELGLDLKDLNSKVEFAGKVSAILKQDQTSLRIDEFIVASVSPFPDESQYAVIRLLTLLYKAKTELEMKISPPHDPFPFIPFGQTH